MPKSHIAILIALLFAAPVGVVALEQSDSTEAMNAQAESVPVEVALAEQPAADDVAVVQEQTVTVVTVEQHAYTTTLPARNSRTAAMDDPFNQADAVWFRPLPAQEKYFAQLERERAAQFAAMPPVSSVFSSSGFNSDAQVWKPLPAQVAYFERVEQQRIASARSQPLARSESYAQAGSAELAMADSSSIR